LSEERKPGEDPFVRAPKIMWSTFRPRPVIARSDDSVILDYRASLQPLPARS